MAGQAPAALDADHATLGSCAWSSKACQVQPGPSDPSQDSCSDLPDNQAGAKVTCLDKAAIASAKIEPPILVEDVVDAKAYFSLIPIFLTICIYEIGNDMSVMLPLTGRLQESVDVAS